MLTILCISWELNAQVALPTFQGVQARTGCSICDTDLVLYYDFESGSGSVSDLGISGNETNGTFQGDADYYSSGKYGNYSMQSPASSDYNDYLDITGDITDLDMTSGYSFMAWVKILGGSGGQGIIVLGACCSASGNTNETGRQGYVLTIESGGSLRFWGGSDNNNTNYNTSYGTSINNGNWRHIGVRVNTDQVQLLVDGSVVTTNTSYASNIPTSPSKANTNNSYGINNPQIGGDGIHGRGFDVLIDEVRVYKEYLSDNDWSSAKSGAW